MIRKCYCLDFIQGKEETSTDTKTEREGEQHKRQIHIYCDSNKTVNSVACKYLFLSKIIFIFSSDE